MKRSHKFANVVFGCAIIFCLAVLIYAAFISRSPSDILIKYEMASLAGIALFGLAFKLREETKVNFALAITSIGVAVYLVEISLFFLAPKSDQITRSLPRISRAEQSGLSFDTRTKHQVVMDLREQGVDAYPVVHPALFIESNGLPIGKDNIYPLGGISEKLTVYCNESGEWSLFDSDEHGFNNPHREASLWEKNYGKLEVDIVLVGDSFTHGACVKPGEEIAGQLRRGDRKVLNLGYGGNGPLIELAALKEYGEPFKPRIVFWLYYEGNDLTNLLKEKEFSFLLKYLDKDFSQGLLKRQPEIDSVLTKYIKAKESKEKRRSTFASDWVHLVKLSKLRNLLKLDQGDSPADSLPLFREVLAEAKEQSDSWGGKLYFIYLPTWDRYGGSLKQDNLYRNEVLSLVKELEIPIIDFHEVLSTHPDPLSLFPFRVFGHYTAEGYRLVAEQIETYLESDFDE